MLKVSGLRKWRPVFSVLPLLGSVLAALSMPSAQADLTRIVEKELFLHDDFVRLGVEAAPIPLTAQEEKTLLPIADLLWSRRYQLGVLRRELKSAQSPQEKRSLQGEIEKQKKRLSRSVYLYNNKIEELRTIKATNLNPGVDCNCNIVPASVARLAKSVSTATADLLPPLEDEPVHALLKTQVLVPTPRNSIHAVAARVSAPAPAPAPKSREVSYSPLSLKIEDAQVEGSGKFGSDFVYSMTRAPSGVLLGIAADITQVRGNPSPALNIVKSQDNGKTWQIQGKLGPDAFGKEDGMYNRLALGSDGQEVFVTTTRGLFYSRDAGRTFDKVPGIDDAGDVKLTSDGKLIVANVSLAKGSVTDQSDRSLGKVRVLERKGSNWVPANTQPEPIADYMAREIKADPRCTGNRTEDCPFKGDSRVLSLLADPVHPDVIYAGTGNHAFRWAPRTGWQALSHGVFNDSAVYKMQLDRASGVLTMSTCNGVYYAQVNDSSGNPIPESQIQFKKIRSPIFASSGGYLRSYDVAVREGHPQDILIAAQSGLFVSRDGGTTVQALLGGTHRVGYGYQNVTWLPDGSIEVSGADLGTKHLTP